MFYLWLSQKMWNLISLVNIDLVGSLVFSEDNLYLGYLDFKYFTMTILYSRNQNENDNDQSQFKFKLLSKSTTIQNLNINDLNFKCLVTWTGRCCVHQFSFSNLDLTWWRNIKHMIMMKILHKLSTLSHFPFS